MIPFAVGSLSNLLAGNNSLTLEIVSRFVLELIKAIRFLHQRRIVHADVKPANILISGDSKNENTWTIKIGDLDGFKQIIGTKTASNEIRDARGTVAYMSPEMLSQNTKGGKTAIGRKTDIWSFGCVVVELFDKLANRRARYLSGSLPRMVRDYSELTYEKVFSEFIIQNGAPYVDSTIPATINTAIKECFRAPQEQRPSAEDLCRHALSLCLVHCPAYLQIHKPRYVVKFPLNGSITSQFFFKSHACSAN